MQLNGILAATYTALNEDGSLALDTINRQAASLKRNNLIGAFVCGTTGEGVSLSTIEREQVAECWTSIARSALKVIVHVGHNSLEESKHLAAHAQKIGADGIAAISPTYFKPARLEPLVAFCAEVAASAPELPFYYYHIPSMTGVNFPVSQFLQQGSERIPNLAGAKFTDDNLSDLGACLRLSKPSKGDQPYNMVIGRDEILLSALDLGAQGAVGSTYNWMAPLYQRVVKAWQDNDIPAAEMAQAKAVQICGIVNRHGGIAAGKAVMKMIGLDCGPVRLPLQNLTSQEYGSLAIELNQAGFFEFCSKV